MNWNCYKKKYKSKEQMQDDEDDEKYCNKDQPHQQDQQDDQMNHEDELEAEAEGSQQQDPLDAFMGEFEEQHKKQLTSFKPSKKASDEEGEEGEEGEWEYEYGHQVREEEELMEQDIGDRDLERDENKNRKIIAPLDPVDFSKVQLEDFDKKFYEPPEQIANMTSETYKKLMKEFEIHISGVSPPNPIVSFAHLPFTPKMIKVIQGQGFEKPTPIQAQVLPCVLSGRDVVGIAKTGSGKTYAFVWPMIIHVAHQRRSEKGEGPIALILAPTRQLCQQIYLEAKRYGKKEQLRVQSLLGGENKHQQWKRLKAGVDILIASPGRLIEFLRKKATNLLRVTYIVLDEADRMMSLGFEQQIRSIVTQTREDRQTLLFTATMKKSMQILVGDLVNSPLRVTVGNQNSANQDVKQEVVMIKNELEKMPWLENNIYPLLREGKILIFVNQRIDSQEIGRQLEEFLLNVKVLVIHGDKNQYERTTIMNQFKADGQILVATEVAARGIDVKNIKNVINFQCPKNIEAYIHRIGRAGRAGETGTAYTFIMPKDIKFAISLVGVFENSGYPVPDELEDLAMLDEGFKRKRIASKMGVSFAKGKDATKYLNQALKRQRRGNSRAGLGMDFNEHRNRYEKRGELNLSEDTEKLGNNATIGDVSTLIRKKMQEKDGRQSFNSYFVKASKSDMEELSMEPSISYFEKKRK